AFPASEFDELKRQQLASIESQRSEPVALAFQAFQRRMTPYPAGHPLAITTLDEDVANLERTTVEQVRAIYTELVGASYGDLAIVGDFDRTAVEAWAKET